MKKHLLFFCIALLPLFSNAQWSKSPNQPVAFGVTQLFSDGNIIWVGGGGSIMKSSDNGENWSAISGNGLTPGLSSSTGFAKIGNRLYATFGGNGGAPVFYTENEGANWTIDTAGWIILDFGFAKIRPYMRHVISYKDQYIIGNLETNYTLYKSAGDVSWKTLSVPDEFRTPDGMFTSGDTLYLAKMNKLAYSTDLGVTWSMRSFNIPNSFIQTLFQMNSDNSKIYCLQTEVNVAGYQIWSSSNFGHTWDSLNYRRQVGKQITNFFVDGNVIHTALPGGFSAGDTIMKSMLSTDGGNTWKDASRGLSHYTTFTHLSFSKFIKHKNSYFTGYANAGAFEMKSTALGITSEKQININIYPNPLKNDLNISVDTEIDKVEISNLSGAIVVSEKGLGTLMNINISDLSEGIYILKCYTENGVGIRKILKY